jgi:predicted RNase H-like HicB family nuclease
MDPQYRIEIEHDGEVWTVSFPKLPGCLARAEDLYEALSAAEFAQDDYLGRWDEAARWGEYAR